MLSLFLRSSRGTTRYPRRSLVCSRPVSPLAESRGWASMWPKAAATPLSSLPSARAKEKKNGGRNREGWECTRHTSRPGPPRGDVVVPTHGTGFVRQNGQGQGITCIYPEERGRWARALEEQREQERRERLAREEIDRERRDHENELLRLEQEENRRAAREARRRERSPGLEWWAVGCPGRWGGAHFAGCNCPSQRAKAGPQTAKKSPPPKPKPPSPPSDGSPPSGSGRRRRSPSDEGRRSSPEEGHKRRHGHRSHK